MTVLYDGVIAFLAAVGVTAILWVLADLVLRRWERPVDAALVLPLRDKAQYAESDVQTLLALRGQLGSHNPVLLVDCGLSEEGRRRAAALEKRYYRVVLVQPAQMEEYIT